LFLTDNVKKRTGSVNQGFSGIKMSEVEQSAELAPAPELEATAATPEPVVKTPEVETRAAEQP